MGVREEQSRAWRKLPQLAVRVRAVPAHHQVGDDLHVMLFQYQDIRAVQAHRIFNLNEDARPFILIQQIIPCGESHLRCGDIDFPVPRTASWGSCT